MAVSQQDRERMSRLARDLADAEVDRAVEGEALAKAVERANARRAARGIPPLREDSERRPEEGLYERARSLGMRRVGRQAT